MRVYKTAWFVRYARREQLNDAQLQDAVDRAERGLIYADLGGGLIKQRVARPGEGKSGGYRTIIVYKQSHRAVFVYGFAKSSKANLTAQEKATYRTAATILLSLDEQQIAREVIAGHLVEITDGTTDPLSQ